MLRFLFVAVAAMLLAACAPFHQPLSSAERAKIQDVDVRVVVAQEGFMFSARAPGVSAATGGGLIGALIDSSVQQSRQKDMSAEVQAITGPLLDYDYRAEAAVAVKELLGEPSTFPWKIRSAQLVASSPTKAERDARIAATRSGPAYMELLVQYALEPGLGAFTTRTSTMLWLDGASKPAWRIAAIYQTPIGGGTRATVLRRLTANDGQVLRSVMRESMAQTLHVLEMDIAGARSGAVKTTRFNVNGSWVTIAGPGFDEQPGRVLFRDQDGALYSVRSSAP